MSSSFGVPLCVWIPSLKALAPGEAEHSSLRALACASNRKNRRAIEIFIGHMEAAYHGGLRVALSFCKQRIQMQMIRWENLEGPRQSPCRAGCFRMHIRGIMFVDGENYARCAECARPVPQCLSKADYWHKIALLLLWRWQYGTRLL